MNLLVGFPANSYTFPTIGSAKEGQGNWPNQANSLDFLTCLRIYQQKVKINAKSSGSS
jgi:hypothetical protein